MIENVLIPEKTVITAKGEGQPVDISGAGNRVFLLTLNISQVVEQESMDVAIYGSADGAAWDAKPLAMFPQRFYAGQTPLLLDLSDQGAVRFVRAQWDVNRWGRGPKEPMFEAGLALREVPAEVLAEVRNEAAARK
jgi:hypothetical protein